MAKNVGLSAVDDPAHRVASILEEPEAMFSGQLRIIRALYHDALAAEGYQSTTR
jgi:hypothetical protein